MQLQGFWYSVLFSLPSVFLLDPKHQKRPIRKIPQMIKIKRNHNNRHCNADVVIVVQKLSAKAIVQSLHKCNVMLRLMARDTAITAEKEASQECAAQDGHEVTDVKGHDSQHAKIKSQFQCHVYVL